MDEENVQPKKGKGSKLGIAVVNPIVLPGSSAGHRKVLVDLNFGKLVFKGLACEQVQGQDPNIKLPWATELVEIPKKDDLKDINQQVMAKVVKVLADLKNSDTKSGWSNVS